MKAPKMQKSASKPQQHHFNEKVSKTITSPNHYGAPKTTYHPTKPKQHK